MLVPCGRCSTMNAGIVTESTALPSCHDFGFWQRRRSAYLPENTSDAWSDAWDVHLDFASELPVVRNAKSCQKRPTVRLSGNPMWVIVACVSWWAGLIDQVTRKPQHCLGAACHHPTRAYLQTGTWPTQLTETAGWQNRIDPRVSGPQPPHMRYHPPIRWGVQPWLRCHTEGEAPRVKLLRLGCDANKIRSPMFGEQLANSHDRRERTHVGLAWDPFFGQKFERNRATRPHHDMHPTGQSAWERRQALRRTLRAFRALGTVVDRLANEMVASRDRTAAESDRLQFSPRCTSLRRNNSGCRRRPSFTFCKNYRVATMRLLAKRKCTLCPLKISVCRDGVPCRGDLDLSDEDRGRKHQSGARPDTTSSNSWEAAEAQRESFAQEGRGKTSAHWP